ncbi:MFS transporter [uncultured Roseobacter sp.]|uniref:MFS transporter n=1 Tax=uncultured Roseobacter sp. TaxID=114847 RepID=UPI00260D1B16|nr:MFS transporter [uncultured Roseobacter sp.]
MSDWRTPWRAVAAMFILNGALFGIWASRVPAVAEKFGLSHAALGFLLLTLAAGAVCSFPIAGKAVDRLGAVRVTRLIAFTYPVTLVALSLAPTQITLGAALFFFGAAHGAMDVAMNGWGAETERRLDRRMMSSFHAMWSFGAGLGALSGYLAVYLGMGLFVHFLISSAAVFAATYYAANIPWESDRAAHRDGSIFAFPTGTLVLVGIVAFCAALGEGAVADWSAVYLKNIVQTSESAATLGYTVFSVAMVIVRLLGDRLVTVTGPVRAARISGICAAVGVLITVLLPSLTAALLGFALMGIGYAVIMPLAFSRAANDPDLPAGQAISSVATLGYGGMLIGPAFVGFVAESTDLQIAFGLLAVLAILIVFASSSLKHTP